MYLPHVTRRIIAAPHHHLTTSLHVVPSPFSPHVAVYE
jgi:hypothetical protein